MLGMLSITGEVCSSPALGQPWTRQASTPPLAHVASLFSTLAPFLPLTGSNGCPPDPQCVLPQGALLLALNTCHTPQRLLTVSMPSRGSQSDELRSKIHWPGQMCLSPSWVLQPQPVPELRPTRGRCPCLQLCCAVSVRT